MRHVVCVSALAVIISHWIAAFRVTLAESVDAAWFDERTKEVKAFNRDTTGFRE